MKKEMKEKIGFVIPCYNSESTIESVLKEVESTMRNMQRIYEVILVNDSSTDNTFEILGELVSAYENVTVINLSRNFGQHAAIMAGFSFLSDDTEIVCCLDDDGQTPADEVYKLISKLYEGYDVVYAKYDSKEHSAFRNFGSAVNNVMTEILLGKPRDLYVSSYFVAHRFVVEEICKYRHSYPYLLGLILRTTWYITNVNVQHRSRKVGKSGYTMKKLLGLWLNGFTAFSIKPLRLATLLGGITSLGGFFGVIYIIFHKFMNPDVPMGWSSTIAAIFFMSGLILMVLGMIGEYIGRIYISINNAPQYVIKAVLQNSKKGQDLKV